MKYSHIGFALESLSGIYEVTDDHKKLVGKRLSFDGEDFAKQIDSTLSTTKPKWVNNQSAALFFLDLLIKNPVYVIPLDQSVSNPPLDQSVSNLINQIQPTPQLTHYFMPSFWGFSDRTEREKVRAAWTEAARLIAIGKNCVRKAENDSTPAGKNFEKWFGPIDDDSRSRVFNVLNWTGEGMLYGTTRFTYAGGGASQNKTYKESGAVRKDENGLVSENRDSYAFVNSKTGNFSQVTLASLFFNDTGDRRMAHKIDQTGTKATAEGAIVHELTHNFAGTMDIGASHSTQSFKTTVDNHQNGLLSVFRQHSNKPEATTKQLEAKGTAYGAKYCHILATERSALHAQINADSYRLFCEDARYC